MPTDRYRHHRPVIDAWAGRSPGLARVIADPQPAVERAAIDALRPFRVGRDALSRRAPQPELHTPCAVLPARHGRPIVRCQIENYHYRAASYAPETCGGTCPVAG